MSTNRKRNHRQTPNPEARSPDPPVGTLPDLGDPATEAPATASLATLNGDTPPEGPQTVPQIQKPFCGTQTITIEIPIGELSERGYITRHVEVNRLSTAQMHALNRVLNGLRGAGAKLTEHDRLVDTPPDAMRWLLDLVADAVGG